MGSTGPATVIIRVDLGAASAFDQDIFPLEYHAADGNLEKGGVLVKATLEEMEKIAQLGIDLSNNDDFIYDTTLSVNALKEEEEKIRQKKNRKAINPFTAFRNYRAARLFHKAAKALYNQTKRTSEKIRREETPMQVVPSSQMQRIDRPVLPSTSVVGVSVDLPDGWNNDARRTILGATTTITNTDPFGDNPLIPQLREGEDQITLADTASLFSQDTHDPGVSDDNQTSVASGSDLRSSPQIVNITYFRDSVLMTNSNVTGLTANRDSSHSSGASVTQQFAP